MKNLLTIPLLLMLNEGFSQDNPPNKFLFDGDKITLSTFYVELAPSTA